MRLVHSLTALALALLAGCGVEPVTAARKNVSSIELRQFPKQDWRLVNNKFFLWREDMTPEQVSRANAIAKEIDRLDGLALPLIRQRIDLEKRVEPLKDSTKLLAGHLRTVKSAQDRAQRKETAAKKAAEDGRAALAVEKEKEIPDTAKLSTLTQQIAVAESQLAAAKEQVAELKAIREKLEKDQKGFQDKLEPLARELADVETKQLDIELQGRAQVDQIVTVVDWYNTPPDSVSFQFQRNGPITADIVGWNLADDQGQRKFSTRPDAGGKATITKVTYTELGGVFAWDVHVYRDPQQTQLRETYSFKVARTNYDSEDGRVFFIGELVRRRTLPDGKTEVRRGVAKLIDRNS